MDIKELSIDQLKVLAFDEMLKRDQAQQNLNIILKELQESNSEEKVEVEE